MTTEAAIATMLAPALEAHALQATHVTLKPLPDGSLLVTLRLIPIPAPEEPS